MFPIAANYLMRRATSRQRHGGLCESSGLFAHHPAVFRVRAAPKSDAREPHGSDALRLKRKHHGVRRESTKAQTSDLQHQSVTAEWTTRRPDARSTARKPGVLGSKLGD